MTINVSECSNVRLKLRELGCRDPSGFAILPINFETAEATEDFRQASEAATVKTLLRSSDLPYTDILAADERPPYIQNNAFEWLAPTLFISAALILENPDAVVLAFNKSEDYVKSFLAGLGSNSKVKLSVVVEEKENETYKKISYEGAPEGLSQVVEAIRATRNDS